MSDESLEFEALDNAKPKRWRKRPVEITAQRMTEPFQVDTLEGLMTGKAGDWLITGVRGEQYPCDDAIFRETYEPAHAKPESIAQVHTDMLLEELKRRGWGFKKHRVPIGYDGDEWITVRELKHKEDPRNPASAVSATVAVVGSLDQIGNIDLPPSGRSQILIELSREDAQRLAPHLYGQVRVEVQGTDG